MQEALAELRGDDSPGEGWACSQHREQQGQRMGSHGDGRHGERGVEAWQSLTVCGSLRLTPQVVRALEGPTGSDWRAAFTQPWLGSK